MGKAKKELTNQRRAARLGTGAGIAPARPKRGGIPPWAWLVGGAVLLAAVIVAVAVIATRGSGSSASGSGGQNAAVVDNRLSHSKIDFVSQGTWQPDYTNLKGAMQALGLTASAESASLTHYHVHIRIVADGHAVPLPAQIGLDSVSQVFSEVHTHDETGVIHIESPQANFRAKLLDAFDMWGVYLSPQCLGGYCGGVKMWVNGKPSTAFGNLVLQPHMAITILAGQPPAGFKPDTSYAFAAGE
jgi:hypothetical protein